MTSRLRSFVFLLLLVVGPARHVFAQELDAQVELNVSALPEQERQIWENFRSDVANYLNNNQWTSNFSGERIRCTFQFNIVGRNNGDYNAQIFVTSSRPLYQSEQVTTMARFFDDKVEFPYERGTVLQRGSNFRRLESVLDFYTFVILGLDFDSYQKQSGTPYYQQAHEVAVIASSAGAKGWDKAVSSTGTFSRLGYIEDVLNANNRGIRDIMWSYNYEVMDLTEAKPDVARVNLAHVIDTLAILRKSSSLAQRSPFLRTFFEAKYSELADLSRFFPDNVDAYFQKLVYLDPLHQTYYDQSRSKVRR